MTAANPTLTRAPDQVSMMLRCARCGQVTGESRDRPDGSLCMACLIPPCAQCGKKPGKIEVSGHGLLCLGCWTEDRLSMESA